MAFNFNWNGLQLQQIVPKKADIDVDAFSKLGAGLRQDEIRDRKEKLEDEQREYQKQLWQGQIDSNAREAEKYKREVQDYNESKAAAKDYSQQIQGNLNTKQQIMAEIQRLEAENQSLQAALGGV